MQDFWRRFYDRQKKLSLLLLAAYMVFVLAGCLQTSSPTTSATATPGSPNAVTATVRPSATTLPPKMLLYQADWSRGLAGWQRGAGWSIAQGQLQVSYPGDTSITFPYSPVAANYAIEVRVKLVDVLQTPGNWFFITVDKTATKDGYEAGFQALAHSSENPDPSFYGGFAQASADELNPSAGYNEIDYVPGFKWRTYRVEVQGNQVTLFIDGTRTSISTSRKDGFADEPPRLESRGLRLSISSVRITAL